MKAITNVLLAGLLLVSAAAQSREFRDVTVPDNVRIEGTDVQLQLNGVGMRVKFIFDVYVGALYLEKPATTREQVIAQAGPKRVLMHFVYDEVGADKLVDGWTEGFRENQTREQYALLEQRINDFNAMFSTVLAGDVVLLDYIPGRGTIVSIRGEEMGVIEGADFYNAVLDIWLGEEPADDDLKEAMLGGD